MVKINDIASLDQISVATGIKAATPEGAMSFTDALRNAIKEIDSPEAEDTITNVSATGSAELAPSGASDDVVYVMDQTNYLLEALEEFATSLAGSSTTLKQVDPNVRRIEDMAGELEQSLEQLEDIDEELSGLVQQVLAQSKVEVMKFQRGDYI